MSRYRVYLIVFVAVSVIAAAWLFLERINYATVGFDCDIPNLYGVACLEAAQRQIAHRVRIEGPVIGILWSISLWLFIRERKKR